MLLERNALNIHKDISVNEETVIDKLATHSKIIKACCYLARSVFEGKFKTFLQENVPILGQRHLQVFMLFLGIVINFVQRLNIGVALVAMTNANTTNPNFEEYGWNEMEKSYIISSFFALNWLTQLPGGYLCRHFGAKKTMLYSTLGSTLAALAPPFCVTWGGWEAYCGLRIIMGLFQGVLFPCMYALLAAWCPVNERNRLGALAFTGIEFGTVLAMYLSGFIAASSVGWPGISYISGVLGLTWCLFWSIFAATSPSESKLISDTELSHIESSKSAERLDTKDKNAVEPECHAPVPWRAIMTSGPFWAVLSARLGQAWGFTTLQAQTPSYMNGVLAMDIKENALLYALPYVAMWLMSYVYLLVADLLLSRRILSLTALRKTFNSLSFYITAAGLVAVGYVDAEQKTLAVVLLTASVGISSGSTIGSALNTIDLSPNNAGILMGIVNTGANIMATITPLVVGLIVHDEHNRTQWQIVFIITAVIFVVTNIIFVVFGSTDIQPWDSGASGKNLEVEKSKEQIE